MTPSASMKVALVSLGCARTLVDSEVALGSLEKEGYQIVQDVKNADIAIVNTCGFIEEAKLESIETILNLCELKKKGHLKAVVMLGCLSQRYGDELQKELKDVDAIVGTNNFGDLAEVLRPIREKKKVFEYKAKPRFILTEKTGRHLLTPKHYAYIKISEGCINACSYCAIPKMKGAHRSRTIQSVLKEIKTLSSKQRLSEINLIGQDTTAFGYDRDKAFELPKLLTEIAKQNLVPWVRFLYAHPGHVTEELIEVMAKYPSLCKYIDFPIEHSHDEVLRRMNRGVMREKMEWGIKSLRKKMPTISIRTAVIVGSPGETEEEFQDLLDFLKEVRFEKLGAFIFSPEEGTKAYHMPHQVPLGIKRERYNAVMSQQQEISRQINDSFLGKSIKVLLDEKDPNQAGVFFGRTEGDAPEVDGQVIIHSKKLLKPGDFVNVKITDTLEYDLVGIYESS